MRDLRCPFGCEGTFTTKTALQRHRTRLHFRKRAPKDVENENVGVPEMEDVVEILRRAAPDSTEFVVYTKDESYEYRALPMEDERVKAFLEKDSGNSEAMPLVDMDAWVNGGEVILDSDDEQEIAE